MLKFFRKYGDLHCRVYQPILMQDWLAQTSTTSQFKVSSADDVQLVKLRGPHSGTLETKTNEPLGIRAQNSGDFPELLVKQIFDQFRLHPIISPSTLLAKVVLENPKGSRATHREKFLSLCQQHRSGVVFDDFEKEFERIYDLFVGRGLFEQPDILKYYANILDPFSLPWLH